MRFGRQEDIHGKGSGSNASGGGTLEVQEPHHPVSCVLGQRSAKV